MIFVDTSFLVAYANRRDDRHRDARLLLGQQASAHLVTTNHVRGESWTFLRRRLDHHKAVLFLRWMQRSARLRVVHVGEEIEGEALTWLERHDEREFSFVDATSFALMRALRIGEALAFDGDFSAAGFAELRP